MYKIQYKNDKKIVGEYMGVEFANNTGVTESEWLAKRHKLKGATVEKISSNNGAAAFATGGQTTGGQTTGGQTTNIPNPEKQL